MGRKESKEGEGGRKEGRKAVKDVEGRRKGREGVPPEQEEQRDREEIAELETDRAHRSHVRSGHQTGRKRRNGLARGRSESQAGEAAGAAEQPVRQSD